MIFVLVRVAEGRLRASSATNAEEATKGPFRYVLVASSTCQVMPCRTRTFAARVGAWAMANVCCVQVMARTTMPARAAGVQ